MNTQSEEKKLESWIPNDGSGIDKEVYRFLVTYYLYQDQLSWSRTQTLFLVEAALLAAAFAKQGSVAVCALSLGIVFIALIWCVVERDWEIRDQHLAVVDQVHKPRGLRMIVPATTRLRSGSFILRLVFVLLIALNVFLSYLFFFCDPQGALACQACALVNGR